VAADGVYGMTLTMLDLSVVIIYAVGIFLLEQ
jgi:hypothetical protein